MIGSVLKFGCRLLWGRLTGRIYPFLVQLSVTSRCNARCRYCYATYYDRQSDDMPFEQITEIIDCLKREGTFRLNLVGGEPLLRKDIGKIIQYARGKKIACAMTTNGVLVPEKINEIKDLDTVCFSLDGRSEANDFNRGKGSYEKVIAGMDACKANNIKVQLSAVLSKQTAGDVDFMVDLAQKYGCKVGFATLISQEREGKKNTEGLFPLEDDIRKALRCIIELKKQGRPIIFSSETYQYSLNWPDYTRDIIMQEGSGLKQGEECPSQRQLQQIPCYAGRYFCIIDSNGDVYPCPQIVGLMKVGNIFRDGFKKSHQMAAQHKCLACSTPCSNEFNMFFDLNPKVLYSEFLDWRK